MRPNEQSLARLMPSQGNVPNHAKACGDLHLDGWL